MFEGVKLLDTENLEINKVFFFKACFVLRHKRKNPIFLASLIDSSLENFNNCIHLCIGVRCMPSHVRAGEI